MRPDWDEYFIKIAKSVAERSTCDRASVGCVIVSKNRVLATGYNSSISGQPHCSEVGHKVVNHSCIRAVHAEENAIAAAARFGIAIDSASAYVTHFPCWRCFRSLVNAGIMRIVYGKHKTDVNTAEMLEEYSSTGVELVDLSTSE